jgi:hypothetical protein
MQFFIDWKLIYFEGAGSKSCELCAVSFGQTMLCYLIGNGIGHMYLLFAAFISGAGCLFTLYCTSFLLMAGS